MIERAYESQKSETPSLSLSKDTFFQNKTVEPVASSPEVGLIHDRTNQQVYLTPGKK